MDTALCVVDMQPGFELDECWDRVVKNIIKEIKQAKAKGQAIFVVEMAYFKHTYPEILEAIKSGGYKYYRVVKSDPDGSVEILRAVKRHRLDIKRFRVCGIYRSQCVYATASGLADLGAEVSIIYRATSNDHRRENEYYQGRYSISRWIGVERNPKIKIE